MGRKNLLASFPSFLPKYSLSSLFVSSFSCFLLPIYVWISFLFFSLAVFSILIIIPYSYIHIFIHSYFSPFLSFSFSFPLLFLLLFLSLSASSIRLLSSYLSFYLSIHPSVYPSVCLYLCIYPSSLDPPLYSPLFAINGLVMYRWAGRGSKTGD